MKSKYLMEDFFFLPYIILWKSGRRKRGVMQVCYLD